MPIRRDQARPGPAAERPGASAGPIVTKKQRTAAKARKGGPHWCPVEILVGGRQPELPNANRLLAPLLWSGLHTLHPLCVPTRAQAAAQAGVFVNERHSQSTSSYREAEADKAFPGMLEQLCGSSGKHTFPKKDTGRGSTKTTWGLAEALKRPETGPAGAVYRHFKATMAYARGTLTPLYAALCVKGPNGQLMLPSGWQQQDMLDGMKYNLANQSKVGEELNIQVPEQTSSLQSASSTEDEARATPDDNGGGGGDVTLKTPVQKRAASDEAAKLLLAMGSSGDEPESGSDHEWRGASQSQGAADDEEDDVVHMTRNNQTTPTPPSTPPHPHPHPP